MLYVIIKRNDRFLILLSETLEKYSEYRLNLDNTQKQFSEGFEIPKIFFFSMSIVCTLSLFHYKY